MNKSNNVLIALILGCTVADNMHITQALSSSGVSPEMEKVTSMQALLADDY